MYAMTHSYVWHDSFICGTRLIHMCDMTHSHVWHASFICVTWRVQTRDMTHSYVQHDSFLHMTWLIRMCDMTHFYARYDSRTDLAVVQIVGGYQPCVTWRVQTRDTTHFYVRRDAFLCVIRLTNWSFCPSYCGRVSAQRDGFRCATWRIPICDMSFRYNKAAFMVLMLHLGMCHENRPVCRANHRQETLWMYRVAKTHRIP